MLFPGLTRLHFLPGMEHGFQSMDLAATLPGLESQRWPIAAVWPWASDLVMLAQVFHLSNEDENNASLIGILYRVPKIVHAMYSPPAKL